MSDLYYVKCDRCKVVAEKVKDKREDSMFSTGYSSPKKWTCNDGKDYCPECSKKRKNWLIAEGFI